MPKIVDRETRRRDVAQAVLRVVVRDGIAHASLRNVADEAGLAVGSIRHYFSSHDELMIFALRALSDAVAARLLAHIEKLTTSMPATHAGRRAVTENLLAELLPLDDSRRQEAIVWLDFNTAARTDAKLQSYARELSDLLRRVVSRVLVEANETGKLVEGLDIDLETERLCAMLEGLAMTAVSVPDRMEPELAMSVLRRHLDALVQP